MGTIWILRIIMIAALIYLLIVVLRSFWWHRRQRGAAKGKFIAVRRHQDQLEVNTVFERLSIEATEAKIKILERNLYRLYSELFDNLCIQTKIPNLESGFDGLRQKYEELHKSLNDLRGDHQSLKGLVNALMIGYAAGMITILILLEKFLSQIKIH